MEDFFESYVYLMDDERVCNQNSSNPIGIVLLLFMQVLHFAQPGAANTHWALWIGLLVFHSFAGSVVL